MKLGLALAAILVTQAVPAAPLETAERPQWKVGDKWQFRSVENPGAKESSWSTEVIEELADGHLKVRMGTGAILEVDGEANSLDKRGAEYSWKRFKFPLSVGGRWDHDYKIAGVTWNGQAQSKWKVRGYEKITVPAGTFDCLKVEGDQFSNWYSAQSMAQQWNHFVGKTTYWYCPVIKWAARWELESQYPGAARVIAVSELVSFTSKP